MTIAYLPGSKQEALLGSIAEKLHGKRATDFYGIVVNGYRVVYRHAHAAYHLRADGATLYPRWNWQHINPGDDADYLLMHADDPSDAYFLLTWEQAKKVDKQFIARSINIPAIPIQNDRHYQWLEPYLVPSLAELKRLLNK